MKKSLLLKNLLIILLAGFVFLKLTSAQAKQFVDQIVAIVNEDVITESELNTAIQHVKIQMRQQNIALPTEAVLQKKMLDQLINKKIQLQSAKQLGLTISDAEFKTAIERLANLNHVSTAEFYQRLKQEGILASTYNQEMREQLLIHKIQQRELAGKINISQVEKKRFIEKNAAKMTTIKAYHIEDILIALPEQPSSTELQLAENEAQKILSALQAGQSFTKMMAASKTKQNVQLVDLGWKQLQELPSAFTHTIADMRIKEIAGPIKAANGLHLLRLVNTRNIGQQAGPEPKQLEAMLMQQKYEEAVKEWVGKLRAQTYVVTYPNKQA